MYLPTVYVSDLVWSWRPARLCKPGDGSCAAIQSPAFFRSVTPYSGHRISIRVVVNCPFNVSTRAISPRYFSFEFPVPP